MADKGAINVSTLRSKVTDVNTVETPADYGVLAFDDQDSKWKVWNGTTWSELGVTREFSRAWSDELLFNKNEIDYAPKELTGNVTYTVAGSGNLVNGFSSAIQTIITDGSHSLSFTGFNFIYGIQNGEIPDAGTYQIFFMYRNGIATAHWATPSSEVANATQLLAPSNFAAVADGENAIDLSWTDVSNESSYQIEKSATGDVGTYVQIGGTIAAGTTSYSDTGLDAGQTWFYRIKAVGDGEDFLDSPYSSASATTESIGDVSAPTFTFSPTNGSATWAVNRPIVITASEGLREDDGTELNDANVASHLTLKETNSGGADIPFTATVDASKTIITITPSPSYGATQVVYVAIDGVEDVNGNESALASITFTTTAYTLFDCTSNRLIFGDILDSVFAAADGKFQLEWTIKNPDIVGNHFLWSKYSTSDNQRSFFVAIISNDIHVSIYPLTGDNVNHRRVSFNDCVTTNDNVDQVFVLQYDGAIDTNNGQDRFSLTRNGVPISKVLIAEWGTLGDIFSSTAQLSFGMGVNNSGTPTATSFYCGEAKNILVKSGVADTVEINVPVLIDGEDTSGNNRDGTWV